jgi:hypothetical protein
MSRTVSIVLIAALIAAIPAVSTYGIPAGSDPQHPGVRNSAWSFMLFWFVAMGLRLRRPRHVLPPEGERWIWFSGSLLYILHVIAAFHAFHGWSFDHAFEHTRINGGIGEGIYVSFLFGALWLADAIWFFTPAYQRRPMALSVAIHGFLAFIMFNGGVIFERGPIRVLSLLGFAVLGVFLFRRLSRK